MAAIHGRKSNITIAGKTLANVLGGSFDESTDPYETTKLATTPPTSKAFAFDGLKTYTGNISVQIDDTTAPLQVGDTGEATFRFTNDPGDRKWVGTIGITKVPHVVDRGDVETITYDWTGTGDFVQTWS